jgi:hypothetical protein
VVSILLLVSSISPTSTGMSSLPNTDTDCSTPFSNTAKLCAVSPGTQRPFPSVTVTVSATISTPLLKTTPCAAAFGGTALASTASRASMPGAITLALIRRTTLRARRCASLRLRAASVHKTGRVMPGIERARE